jgi:hypothetical protein
MGRRPCRSPSPGHRPGKACFWRDKANGRVTICYVKIGTQGILVSKLYERVFRLPRLLIPIEAISRIQPVDLPWFAALFVGRYIEVQIDDAPMSIILDAETCDMQSLAAMH